MIISRDTNPERDFYYLGAKVIDILSNHKERAVAFFDIFEILNKKEKISIHLFTLTLDWLFLLGTIKEITKGKIIKCF